MLTIFDTLGILSSLGILGAFDRRLEFYYEMYNRYVVKRKLFMLISKIHT